MWISQYGAIGFRFLLIDEYKFYDYTEKFFIFQVKVKALKILWKHDFLLWTAIYLYRANNYDADIKLFTCIIYKGKSFKQQWFQKMIKIQNLR